ncbi:MAG TPA: hypothetical protein VGK20_11845 [Candidatus Binatia bacterium]|jgi:hypothetical protein
MNISRYGAAVVATALVGLLSPRPVHALTDAELKCSAAVGKNLGKLETSIAKIVAKCHDNDISGKAPDPNHCRPLPADTQAVVDAAKAKFIASVGKSCSSVCSLSNDVVCVSDLSCPASHQNPTAEGCSGKGGSKQFSLSDLGWPGPYCDIVLGHPMRKTDDLGTCLAALVDNVTGPVDQAIYANLNGSSGLTSDSAKCVSKIDKAVASAVSRSYTATASCRDARLQAGAASSPPWACATNDANTMTAIASNIDKLNATIDKSCASADITALAGLCAAAGVTPITVQQAKDCLDELVREEATEELSPSHHVFSVMGLLNVSHPASAKSYCGDGIVEPTREEHTGVGEECDGSDAPCGSGHCLPPGDTFECTCDSTPRERFIVQGDAAHTDSDAGWEGSSHDATHNDGFGYVTAFTNCDCTQFSGATCTGASANKVCDVHGDMEPRCSDDPHGTQSCDERGDNDGAPEDYDCYRCDDDSLNPGTFCVVDTAKKDSLCQSQCVIDSDGTHTGIACQKQGDCATGQSCRGRCDDSITCNQMSEGSPLPLISASTPVCVMLQYLTDITGTKNIVTGEQAVHYTTRSNIQTGQLFKTPCPVCGGGCVGGSNSGVSCFGRCNASHDKCLVDSDCTGMGDTTCAGTSDDCPGGTCSLELRCDSGQNAAHLCTPDAKTPLGVVSHDCPPIPSQAVSGKGLLQPFGTVTTEAVQFPPGGPCSDPSFKNFDCPCPADIPNPTCFAGPNAGNPCTSNLQCPGSSCAGLGVPTRPNSCSGACDGGINAGHGCATGAGGGGAYTTCVLGSNAGLACDEDSDCPGGSCSGQPKECTAGLTTFQGFACSINSDCGPGGVCSNPCPGARCVPLCLQEGKCHNGARDGDVCSTLDHCKQCTAGNPSMIGVACDTNSRCNTALGSGDGVCAALPGVTCDLADPNDGLCAAGPTKFRCNGTGYTTVPCDLNYGECSPQHVCKKGNQDKIGSACTVDANCLDHANTPVSSGCETGPDTVAGTADDIPGAGECEPRPEDCFVNNGFSEGGDTINGNGSPTNVYVNAAFCVPPNANSAVNTASGFGGPSRIRRKGTAVVNVPSIP